VRAIKVKKMKRVNRLQFTPDGTRLLVLGGYEVRGVDHVAFLDPVSGEEAARVEAASDAAVVSPDGTRVVAADPYGRRSGGSLHWREAADGAKWVPIPAAKGATLVGVAFSPDGERLAVGRSKRTGSNEHAAWHTSVALWRFDPLEEVLTFPVASDPRVMEFSRDGAQLAVTGGIDGDRMVCVHDTTTGQQRYAFVPKGTQSRGLAFDATGRLAVVNSKWVYVLPPGSWDPQFVLASESKQMNAGIFSPDGRRILTGAHDGSLRVWDAADGREVRSFDWQVGPVTAVAFAPDGLTCAAAGLNGKVVIWDVDG
jgi:WD40 repeat protein